MECPRRWTAVAVIIYLSFRDSRVFCQNELSEEGFAQTVVRDNRACGNPTSTELFNSILNIAASNGVLPDLLPMLQGQPISDNFQRLPYPQEALAKPLSVVPMPQPGCVNTQEPILCSSQPIRPPNSNQNVIVATPLPCAPGCPPNALPATPQTFSLPPLPPANCQPQIAQVVPQGNYPTCAQNAFRPSPIVLQPQNPFNEVNPYNYNQIFEPLSFPEVNTQSLTLPILPPPQVLPAINTCTGSLEITPNLVTPCIPQPTVLSGDCQQLPLSLQINVPTPTVPAPKITVVSASPQNTPVAPPLPYGPDFPPVPPYQYPPQPPIVIGGSKSSLRNLLPIILVALFSERGNSGGGCCCCSCNGGNSGNNIPIPYPIPIPVNNPIINNACPCSSRYREQRDDGDDDDDDYRKRK